jgi:CTP:molybdopterin cytidylyltransferase MocA
MNHLTGDRGCRPILDLHPGDILEVEVDSESVVADIDSWEQYKAMAVTEREVKGS